MTKTSHFCLTESFLIMKYFYTFLATIVFSTSIAQVINYTVEVPAGTTAVRLTGPWWGWDPAGGPVATDNGDGTWTVSLDQTENIANGTDMEYLWVVDGVQENLIANAVANGCINRVDAGELITDNSTFANRVWLSTTGDVIDNAYNTCSFLSSTDFEDDSSLRGWEGIGDGAGAEASFSRIAAGGNAGGALSLSGTNTVNTAGRNYQFRVVDADYNYFNAATVTVSFDAKKDGYDNGDVFVNINSTRESLTATITDVWQEFSYDVAVSPTNTVNELSLRFELIVGAIIGAGGTVLIDNLSITTSGTTSPPAEPADAPTTPPTRDAADVISIYGEAYDTAIGVTDVGWDEGSTFAVETIAENEVMKAEFVNFLGLDLGSEVDATAMTHMHMDIWIQDAHGVGQVFKPKWSNHNGAEETDAMEHTREVVEADSQNWVAIDVALDDLDNARGLGPDARANLKQLVISTSATLDVVYIDNIYFYKSATAGIDNAGLTGIKLYPNPVKSTATISADQTVQNVQIYDLTGRVVHKASPNKANFNLDVSHLSKGVYLVKVNAGNQEATLKLAK